MPDKDSIRRSYDELAEIYAEGRSEGGYGIEVLEQFLDFLSQMPRILDAGCGQGSPVLRRLTESATAIGIDFSREQLRLADENASGAPLVQGDMTTLPFQDDVFDAVTAYHSLIHIPIDDHQTVIDEFARILRPNGRLLLSEGMEEWTGKNSDWLDSDVEMQWSIAGADATREHVQNAGFTVINEWSVTDTFAEDKERWVFFATQLDT